MRLKQIYWPTFCSISARCRTVPSDNFSVACSGSYIFCTLNGVLRHAFHQARIAKGSKQNNHLWEDTLEEAALLNKFF